MSQSDKVRKHPLFFGPYTIKKVVQGEAIEWVPNKYYGGRKPKLDKVVEEVVPVAQVAEAMRSHKYDIILHESRATYAKTSKVDQYVTLGTMAYGLQYMGFRVGDKNPNGKSVLDKELVTNNRALRLALYILVKESDTRGKSEYRYLRKNGNAEDVIDVAILAEGYNASQTEAFYRDAEKAVTAILSHEPFKDRESCFNFVAVATVSEDEGVSVPRKKEWKKTSFGSNFDTFFSDRYLTTGNVSDIHESVSHVPYEHIIVLANCDVYGGGGIYNSYTLTTTGHNNFAPVVVHEFGHSFGGLADEYFYEGDARAITDGLYLKMVES